MKKVALYCRVAGGDSEAYQMQQKHLMEYAVQSGITDFYFFGDCGESGLTFDRPMFRKLLIEISSGTVSKVIVTSINRISRNIFQIHQFFEFCEEYGVELVTLDDSHKVAAVELMQMLFDSTKKRDPIE